MWRKKHGSVFRLKNVLLKTQNWINTDDQDMTNEIENADISDLAENHIDGLFACLEQSCRKVYSSPHVLEYHICTGKHVYCNNEKSYDK